MIALNRLNRILRIDPEQRLAVVEPGVINTQVTVAGAPHGLHYAPDPSSQSICTIGGNIAFNSGGAHCLKHGMTSNHVLGLKAVLATGEVVEWGGKSREQAGPDWCGLFVGNEGLFGIALEVTLQLLPKSESFHTVLVGYRSLEQAGDAANGSYHLVFFTPWFPEAVKNPEAAKAFMDAWKGAKLDVGGLTEGFRGWDGIHTIAAAIKDAGGKTDSASITKALWGVHVKGVNGDIAFIKQ